MNSRSPSSAKSNKRGEASTGETAVSAEPTPERKRLEAALLQSVETTMPPQPKSTTYVALVWLMLALVFLVPLVYWTFIGLIAYAIYWHYRYLTEIAILRASDPLGGAISMLVIPLGLLLLLIMLKPLVTLFWWPKTRAEKTLRRDAEPFLFDYVEAICRSVKSPYPQEIRIYCEPNAAAGLKNGLMGVFDGQRVLYLGLPFISGLTLRQLTGVIAHEFGHFSQGAGTRISIIVRHVQLINMHIVYMRDRVDEYFYDLASNASGVTRYALIAVFYAIMWPRRLLCFVSVFVEWIVSAHSREAEFDADQFEYGLVGSDTFTKTSRRLPELSYCYQRVLGELSNHMEEGRLADDFAELVVAQSKRLKPEDRKALAKFVRERKVGTFETHPHDRDRIQRAKEAETKGAAVFTDEQSKLPASVLFRNYGRLCRAATLEFYRQNLERFNPKTIRPSREIIALSEDEIRSMDALDRYFQTHIPLMRPLAVSDDAATPPGNSRQMYAELKRSRDEMVKEVDEYEKMADCFPNADNKLLVTNEVRAMIDHEIAFDPGMYGLSNVTEREVARWQKVIGRGAARLAQKMIPFETVAASRLESALRLAFVPQVQERLPNADAVQADIRKFVPVARFVSDQVASLHTLLTFFRRINALWGSLQYNQGNEAWFHSFTNELANLYQLLTKLSHDLSEVSYPFEHARKGITLQGFLIPDVPEENDLAGLMQVAEGFTDRVIYLQVRLFARLATAAEKVEIALGLSPLPPRKKKKTS